MMASVFLPQKGWGHVMVNLLDKHGPCKIGRWCEAPKIPDRCYFCPLADIQPASGFVTFEGWRHGYCAAHEAEAKQRGE